MINHTVKTKYNRLTPWVLLLVFVGPWITAQIIYAKRDQLAFKTIETGILLSPPIQAQSLPFYDSSWLGKWQIVYMNTENTDATNNNVSYKAIVPMLNQLHAALGKEKYRVAYQIISAQYASSQNASVLAPGEIAIIDPRGWLIMHYPPNPDPIGILKDIRKLLRYSHGG